MHFIGIVLMLVVERQKCISYSLLVLTTTSHVLLSLHSHCLFFGSSPFFFLNRPFPTYKLSAFLLAITVIRVYSSLCFLITIFYANSSSFCKKDTLLTLKFLYFCVCFLSICDRLSCLPIPLNSGLS